MDNLSDNQELRDRLSLIENIISEGRRSTQRWGWTFVLWGVVYYAAIAWANLGHSVRAWPVCSVVGMIATCAIAFGKHEPHPPTTIGRTIASIWIAMGISTFFLMFSLGLSGRYIGASDGYQLVQWFDPHLFVAVVASMLGLTNAAMSMILRWKAQLLCAIVWWAAAMAGCFGTNQQAFVVFLVAIFLCQIVFGTYCMIAESRARKSSGASHA